MLDGSSNADVPTRSAPGMCETSEALVQDVWMSSINSSSKNVYLTRASNWFELSMHINATSMFANSTTVSSQDQQSNPQMTQMRQGTSKPLYIKIVCCKPIIPLQPAENLPS